MPDGEIMKDSAHKKSFGGGGIIARMGGKKLLAKRLVEKFPDGYEDMTYIEPFVGGGSVLLTKNISKKEVINDLDGSLIDLYRGFKKFSYEKIKGDINNDWTKEEFLKIRDSNPKTEYGKFIKNFLTTRLSFYSLGKSWGARGKVGLKNDYGARLKDVEINNEDYVNLINKYAGKNTFFYFDPPYEGSTNKHYSVLESTPTFDYTKFKNEVDIVNKKGGLFMISINDSPFLRKLFKGYNIETIGTKYTNPLKGGQDRDITELIITNYKK